MPMTLLPQQSSRRQNHTALSGKGELGARLAQFAALKGLIENECKPSCVGPRFCATSWACSCWSHSRGMPSSRRRARLCTSLAGSSRTHRRGCWRVDAAGRGRCDAAAAPVAPLLARRALPGAFATAAVAARAARAAASDLLDVCPTCDQPIDALPLATIRGKWSLDAQWTEDGAPRELRGTVAFRSLGDPNRGRCSFSSDTLTGSGSWAEKPARIRKGQFTWSARWRLRLSDGTVLAFRGDTSTGAPDDFMEVRRPPSINDGEVLVEEPVQRRVGSFTATQVVSWQATRQRRGPDDRRLRQEAAAVICVRV